VLAGKALWIKSTWGLDGRSQFAYSLDGRRYTEFGVPYQLSWGHYRGNRIGLFSYNNKTADGYADIDSFYYTVE